MDIYNNTLLIIVCFLVAVCIAVYNVKDDFLLLIKLIQARREGNDSKRDELVSQMQQYENRSHRNTGRSEEKNEQSAEKSE